MALVLPFCFMTTLMNAYGKTSTGCWHDRNAQFLKNSIITRTVNLDGRTQDRMMKNLDAQASHLIPAGRKANTLGCEKLKESTNTVVEITSLRVIPSVTPYYYIFVTNSDILCAKIWRGREGEYNSNSDEI